MGNITNLLYGLSIASFFIVVMMIGMAESSEKYNATYNSSDIESYDKLEEINNISKDIRSNSNSSLSSNPLDVLGEFFKTGYSSVRLTTTSIDVVDDMSNQAVRDANLGESGNSLTTLFTTLIVIFVMGTIIAIAIGRDW